MKESFNLINEPWIPCLRRNGEYIELGLRETLLNAHELREVLDNSPLVTLSILRLLLAFLHRSYDGPKSIAEWKAIKQKGIFDPSIIDQYLHSTDDEGNSIQSRFDLFGEHPFFQDPKLLNEKKIEMSSIVQIAREYSSGNNATLFDHTMDDSPPSISYSIASRLLVSNQIFALQDGSGYCQSALTRGATVFVYGSDLFDTLLYNLCQYNSDLPFPKIKDDKPSWERTTPPETDIPSGYLSYLTWQYRRIFLINDQFPIIRKIYIKPNKKPDKEWTENTFDPMLFYRRSEKKGYDPISIDKEKALWRDSSALASLIINRKDRYPAILDLLAETDTTQTQLNVFGTDNKNNKIFIWRHERLPFPTAYLKHDNLVAYLETAIYYAEKIEDTLHQVTKTLAQKLLYPFNENKRKPDLKQVKQMKESFPAITIYWSTLEEPFFKLYRDLPKDDEAAQEKWCDVLRKTAFDSLKQTVDGLDGSARSIRAAAEAYRQLSISLGSSGNWAHCVFS